VAAALFVVGGVFPGEADQEDVATNLPPIWVTARPLTTLLARSPTAVFADEPLVLINSQGRGAQNDLTIRGSSFSGAGLSLAGVALHNPQTEHFNLELPFPMVLLTPPERLTGAEQQRAVDGHAIGTLSLDFRPLEPIARLQIGAGERERNWQDFLYQTSLRAESQADLWGLSLFGVREEDSALDYRDNDLERLSGGAHLQWRNRAGQADLAVGSQQKKFGARGYYGVASNWPAQEQITDTLGVFSAVRGDRNGGYRRLSIQGRSLEDDYRLFLSSPVVYENHHRSIVWSAFADGHQPVHGEWALDWRVGAEDEALKSNRLGNHRRSRGVLLLMPEWARRRIKIFGGDKLELFTDDEPAHLPQAGIEYACLEAVQLYGTYSETVRQPSFTELNYESPGSLGNRGLRRQETRNAEAGVRGAHGAAAWHAAAFISISEHTVDWAKPDPTSPRWEALDLGRVETRGVELESRYWDEPLSGSLGYTFLSKSSAVDPYASRYVLDFPEHLLKCSGTVRLNAQWRLTGSQGLRWQTRNPAHSGRRWGLPATASVHWAPRLVKFLDLSMTAENLWGDDFESYPGLPAAPRRVSLAATFLW